MASSRKDKQMENQGNQGMDKPQQKDLVKKNKSAGIQC